ncbi:phenylalanine--tRNA ligase subunit beta [bacterium]|nr:phenylalanine--tRNA ligase subunit beta [bacterium]
MRLPLGQLKKFINIDNISLEELDDQLTQIGIEVEEIHEYGKEINSVFVGQVKEKDKHPNADKLNLCVVDIGREEPLNVVCGADNFSIGDKVAVATIGGTLPGGFKMKKTKIRGIASEGMICASDELEIDSDHSGIMVLSNDAPVGKDFTEYINLADHVLELELTANRGDHLSVKGIARDLAAKYTQCTYKSPDVSDSLGQKDGKTSCDLEIQAQKGCNRYILKTISNIKNGESPYWLKIELGKFGLRPINHVVDVTNFILQELGHPMHAFDLDKLKGRKIIVRYAKDGEKLKTLDEREIKLDSSDLVIADIEKPIALAGVMGGFDSQVDENTKNIALEFAHFDPILIRKTSKKHGFHTDSSHRFERFVDPESIPEAVGRAIYLLNDISEPDTGYIDLYPHLPLIPEITLRIDRIKKIIGKKYPYETVRRILSDLQFKIIDESKDEWLKVQVPSFRLFDVSREIDLIEEIVRIDGYNNFSPEFARVAITPGKYHGERALITKIKSNLTSLNIDEAMTFSFGSKDYFKEFVPEDFNFAILRNPLSEEYSTMRPVLFANLLSAVKKNHDLGDKGIQFFEIGKIFSMNSGKFCEHNALSIIMTEDSMSKFWNKPEEKNDFYSLKGMLENLFDFTTEPVVFSSGNEFFLHPGINAEIHFKGSKIGFAGKIHPSFSKKLGFNSNIYLAEINLSKLSQRSEFLPKFTGISKFPGAERDIALVVSNSTPFSAIEECVKASGGNNLKWVKMFDYYEGEHVESGFRSIAIRMFFQSDTKTLKEKEINKSFQKIEKSLLNQLNVSKRTQ